MAKLSDRLSLFQRLQNGLEEGIQFARGEMTLRTTELAQCPPPVPAQEIALLRQQLRMSQGVFASMLNVSLKTVQSWEQGLRSPSQAALRLLQVLAAKPEVVCEIVGFQINRRQSRNKSAL